MKILRIYLKFGSHHLSAGYTYLGSIDEALLITVLIVFDSNV